MANEAMMAQILRGSEYQVPEGGYFGDMPQYSQGAHGQPQQQGQGVISQDQLAQAMAPPPPPPQQPPVAPPAQPAQPGMPQLPNQEIIDAIRAAIGGRQNIGGGGSVSRPNARGKMASY